MSDTETYDQLDDLRGTKAIRVTSEGFNARLCVDRRWYDEQNRVVPLDAHGPWTIIKTHEDGM